MAALQWVHWCTQALKIHRCLLCPSTTSLGHKYRWGETDHVSLLGISPYIPRNISSIAHSRVPGGFSNHWHHETRPKARNSVVKVNTFALPENLHLGQLLVFLVMCSWSPQQNDSGLCLERMALPALKLLKEWSCISEPQTDTWRQRTPFKSFPPFWNSVAGSTAASQENLFKSLQLYAGIIL